MLLVGPFINEQQHQQTPTSQALLPPRILHEIAPLDTHTPAISLDIPSTKAHTSLDKQARLSTAATSLELMREQADVQLRMRLHQQDPNFDRAPYQERLETITELSAALETTSH